MQSEMVDFSTSANIRHSDKLDETYVSSLILPYALALHYMT